MQSFLAFLPINQLIEKRRLGSTHGHVAGRR
jgi:hypothetical protein